MPKIFPIYKRTVAAAGGGGGNNGGNGGGGGGDNGGEVIREKLTYDLPESIPALIEVAQILLNAEAFEELNELIEEVVAALLVRADELYDGIQSSEQAIAIVNDLDNIINNLTDIQQLEITTYENFIELINDIEVIETTINELYDSLIEEVNIRTTVTDDFIYQDVSELNTVITSTDDSIPQQLDEIIINGTFTPYASAVVSNTNWTNPNNGLGNTTDTSATLTATSSGLLGATNNTTTGTIVYDYANTSFTDLNVTSVIVAVERSSSINQVLLGAVPTVNVQFQYSIDNTNWTTIATATGTTAKSLVTLDITNIVNGNKATIDNIRIRATGTVTSGTGAGANATCSFFRSFIRVLFNKTY